MADFFSGIFIFFMLVISIFMFTLAYSLKKQEREIKKNQEKIEKEENKKRIYLESIKPVDKFTIEFDEVSTDEDIVNEKVSTIIRAGSLYDIYSGYKNSEIEDMAGEKILKYRDFSYGRNELEIKIEEAGEVTSGKVLLKGNLIGVIPEESIEQLQNMMYSYPFQTKRIFLTGGPYKFFDYIKDKVVTIKDPFGYKVEIAFYKNDPTIEFESL